MYLIQAARLAWANTTEEPSRLIVRCAGITFAVVLMFMQTGFRNALFDSNVRIAEQADADYVLRTRTRFMLSSGQRMPFHKILEARNVLGVAEVQPVYFENVASHLRKSEKPARRIRVMSFDLSSPIFKNLGIRRFCDLLDAPMTAIADKKSKPMFEFGSNFQTSDQEAYGELFKKEIRIVGYFNLGVDFSNDGNLYMTPDNFSRYFSFRAIDQTADYGLIRMEEGQSKDLLLKRLKQQLGPHVIVETKEQFLQSERNFWGKSTPIGLIFAFGTLIGFVVGLIICYQVLATDIGDHMSEFATFKAMGFPSSFFAAVVVIQALFMSIISFVPGLIITLGVFTFVNNFSGLIMFLNVSRTAVVLLLTIGMCVVSGVIALQKLLSSDPANLF
ncbi:MAG: FtsX-like permease family protein [Planctomycetota bacterium]